MKPTLNSTPATESQAETSDIVAEPDAKLEATGFFRVVSDSGRWWLVTPAGERLYSIGTTCVQPAGDHAPTLGRNPYHINIMEKYGSEEAWTAKTASRLQDWGFNTKGAWCSGHVKLPEFQILNFCGGHWLKGVLPDFFTPEFADNADKLASQGVRPDDPMLVAYFLDNEMQWETDWRLGKPIFDQYASLPPDAPGKQAMVSFFQSRYPSASDMGAVWRPAFKSWEGLAEAKELKARPGAEARAAQDREAFTLLAARQYFKITTEAIRRHDPNHMIAGCRFVSWATPIAVIAACGEYCDIVSLNHYELGPLGEGAYLAKKHSVQLAGGELGFANVYQATRRPLLITEFSFRAMDSGMPNTHPPAMFVQPTVPDQAARAAKYKSFVETWAGKPYFVGHHWFRYMDEPKEGRFDGENGNYGLVNIMDEPYEVFVTSVRETNLRLPTLHREASQNSLLDAALRGMRGIINSDRDALIAIMATAKQKDAKAAYVSAALALASAEDAALVMKNSTGGPTISLRTAGGDKILPDAPAGIAERLMTETAGIADSGFAVVGAGIPGMIFEAKRGSSEGEMLLLKYR
ncbi:MAG TPA: hypothetical protein PL033_06065 [Candidatus Brocadiia bacterium]|nr:hypothetical protein [Candidatus Brocadiia bacterium]